DDRADALLLAAAARGWGRLERNNRRGLDPRRRVRHARHRRGGVRLASPPALPELLLRRPEVVDVGPARDLAADAAHLILEALPAALLVEEELLAAGSHAGEIQGADPGLRTGALVGTGREEGLVVRGRDVRAVACKAGETGILPVDRITQLAVAGGIAGDRCAVEALRRVGDRVLVVCLAGLPAVPDAAVAGGSGCRCNRQHEPSNRPTEPPTHGGQP